MSTLPTHVSIAPEALAAICRKHGIAKLSVFGSSLRDDFDPSRSDVDLLAEFNPNANKSLFKILQIEKELSRLFERDIDLTTPGSLSKYFRDDVLSSAVVLYDAA